MHSAGNCLFHYGTSFIMSYPVIPVTSIFGYTEFPALNGNKTKHFVSEMKADIKLCASYFSMVTLPVYSAWLSVA